MKNFDKKFYNKEVKIICGVDEAGRGPLAGPVVAAAVIFEKNTIINGINDSKKLDEKTREKLYNEITTKAVSYGIGIVDHIKIDEINILNATLHAMKIAVGKLNPQPDLILIDGNKSFITNIPTKTIIGGDGKSFSIAAASIIAKVTRDRMMKKEAEKFPHYSWHTNKGYATKAHIRAIREHGPCELHRRSFLSKILDSSVQLKLNEKF
jgi:ribonuclease HII